MNYRYIIVNNSTRDIVRTINCMEDQAAIQAQTGEVLLQHDTATHLTHYLSTTNELVEYTEAQSLAKQMRPEYATAWSNNTMSWIDPRTQEQKISEQWALVKTQRDQLLASSDWRVIRAADTGVPITDSWKTYRQALRDVTQQPDPFNITWPPIPQGA